MEGHLIRSENALVIRKKLISEILSEALQKQSSRKNEIDNIKFIDFSWVDDTVHIHFSDGVVSWSYCIDYAITYSVGKSSVRFSKSAFDMLVAESKEREEHLLIQNNSLIPIQISEYVPRIIPSKYMCCQAEGWDE